MTDSLIETHQGEKDTRASHLVLNDIKQKSSIHFIRGKEVISIIDKHQRFDLGSPNKKRRGKKDENSVLLAKKMWWHMPKKESSKFSNSPPPEKVP
jgi:hypothetical protein